MAEERKKDTKNASTIYSRQALRDKLSTVKQLNQMPGQLAQS